MAPTDPVRIISFDEREASPGLADAVHNSLAYRVAEIERHIHSWEHWLPAALTPVTAISGDNTWGDAVALIAAGDTPIIAGSVYHDLHRMYITDVSVNTTYRIRLIAGASAAAGLAAGTYTEFMMRAVTTTNDRTSVEVQSKRIASATPWWVQVWNATNGATLSLFVGIHEYEG